jgi:hypothetical protein
LIVYYYLIKIKEKEIPPPIPTLTPEEIERKKQLKEAEEIRKEAPILTEEEKEKQLKEAEKIRKEAETQLLSEEERKRQLEEAKKLRSQ